MNQHFERQLDCIDEMITENSRVYLALWDGSTAISAFITVFDVPSASAPSFYFETKQQWLRVLEICHRGYTFRINSRANIQRLFPDTLIDIRAVTLKLKITSKADLDILCEIIRHNSYIKVLFLEISPIILPLLCGEIEPILESNNKTIQRLMIYDDHSTEIPLLNNTCKNLLKRNQVLNRSLFGLCSTLITETENKSLLEELPPILKEHAIAANRDLL